jgi:hypothetical protein
MIERTPATEVLNIRPEEEAAILIVWKQRGHSAHEPVSEADVISILAEIREREAAFERRVFSTLINEGRRVPRRHMTFAFLIVLPIAILIIGLILAIFGKSAR